MGEYPPEVESHGQGGKEMNLGENIKRLRKVKGLTQYELGDIIGKTHVAIGRYEKGERIPSLSKNGLWNYENNVRSPQLSTIEAIAQALEVSVPELLGYPETQIIKEPMELSEVSTDDLMNELARRLK